MHKYWRNASAIARTAVLSVGMFLLPGLTWAAPVTYWNVFNIEGESAVGADIVTYGSLSDMLADTNRESVNSLGGFGANIVGSGSDGSTWWNVFNIEGESAVGADIVTYGSLPDMLADTNRASVNSLGGFGANIVGSGASVRTVQVSEPASLGILVLGLTALGGLCAEAARSSCQRSPETARSVSR